MLLIFMAWHKIEVNQKVKREQREEEKFWEREAAANSVRRKPIDALDYIKIPTDLPTELLPEHPDIPGIIATVEGLRGQKILNLTGYSNTDLKLEYGTANITELSAYDDNYTTLVTTLQKWADLLWDAGYEEEAVKIMEFCVDTGADIGRTYRLLAKHYLTTLNEAKYNELLQKAEELRSLNKPHIIESVKELHY